MKMNRIIAAILAVLVTVTQLTACGSKESSSSSSETTTPSSTEVSAEDITQAEETSGGKYHGQGGIGSKWLAPVLEAYPDAVKPDLKDDFFTAVNYEYLSSLQLKEGRTFAGKLDEIYDIMHEKNLSLINDSSITGHDIEICRAVFNASIDWETRKSNIAFFEDRLRKLMDIKTLDDVYAVLSDDDPYLPNLIGLDISEGMFDEKGKYVLYVGNSAMLLQDADGYENPTQQTTMMMMMAEQQLSVLCEKFGITEGAESLIQECHDFEAIFASALPSIEEKSLPDYVEKSYNKFAYEELKELEKNFPLVEMLDELSIPHADTYIISSPEWLSKISELYTEENVAAIRSYLIVHYLEEISGFLDRDTYEKLKDIENMFFGSTGYASDEEIGLGVINSLVSQCMDHVYIDKYCTPEVRQQTVDMINEFKSFYREMLAGEDWLSAETRNKAIEKLDAMKVNAVYSDYREDFSDLDVKEGDTLTNIVAKVNDYGIRKQLAKIGQPVEEDTFHLFSTREINAYYNAEDNSINILSGILQGVFEIGQGYEHDLASIGWVIGHEISHAFDANGAKYDKDGNYKDWWTSEDYAAYEARTRKLKDYMSQIIPFEGIQAVNGEVVKGEAAADITAVKAALYIAENHDGFDYDVFFRKLAEPWANAYLAEVAGMKSAYNEHPLDNLRVNVSVQQNEKFLEYYGIEEGDGMYIASEDMICIW